ncbi:MAG: L,D-transpeptidase, partial [Acidobacteria bacterium]|nr:L,D-transpeptidase [Acidobacteriota bacterium]
MRHTTLGLIMALSIVAAGCATEPVSNLNSNTAGSPSPSASASPTSSLSTTTPVTLPVLDALFSDEAFKSTLKSKVALTDDQLAQLQKVASDEVARLRQANLEDNAAGAESSQAQQSRERAAEAIRGVIGEQKAGELFALARDYWVKGSEGLDADKAKTGTTAAPENAVLPGPNAVPKDTRVVVNIPAFRMDVFNEGSLIKSYKIGIGYPEFP